MSPQSGWTVIYQAGNGWNFRSKTYASEREAAELARSQWERADLKNVKLLGPAGEMIDLLHPVAPALAGFSTCSSADTCDPLKIDWPELAAPRRQDGLR